MIRLNIIFVALLLSTYKSSSFRDKAKKLAPLPCCSSFRFCKRLEKRRDNALIEAKATLGATLRGVTTSHRKIVGLSR